MTYANLYFILLPLALACLTGLLFRKLFKKPKHLLTIHEVAKGAPNAQDGNELLNMHYENQRRALKFEAQHGTPVGDYLKKKHDEALEKRRLRRSAP